MVFLLTNGALFDNMGWQPKWGLEYYQKFVNIIKHLLSMCGLKRPKFYWTKRKDGMAKVYHLTKHGKAQLESELEVLLQSRKEISERIADARSYGDLSENAEYSSARDEQGINEARISEIENILKNADIIKESKKDTVGLGSTVVLRNGLNVEYKIVGAIEADPLDGKISNESPLGQQLMGKKVGDSVAITTAKGEIKYTIKSIV
jgi:transcription elongation factor GreA